MGRFLLWLFLAFLVAAGAWVYFFLVDAGFFLDLKPVSAGTCRQVTAGGVVGIEDIAIDPETKIAYLAGYDRRRAFALNADPAHPVKPADVRGAVWTYDLNTSDAVPADATTAALLDGFWPHGISLHREPDGRKSLFVINHAGGKHSVEIFDVNGATLTHRRTVTGQDLLSPNDVVAVGGDAFFVTNDHGNASGWQRTAEDYMRLRQSTVRYFDGRTFTTALSGIGGANGINVSADGRSIYLSAASERTVYVYDRDPATNALTKRASIAVPGFADNIDVLPNGDLLLGLHSKILQFLEHVGDAKKPSPGHVMLLKADGKGSFVPGTIYYNLGDEISGVSVGASIDKRLLIGSVFEPKIVDCTWNGAP